MSAMAGAKNTTHLLKQLRAFMKNTKYVSEELHAYIVPSSDAHGSEYLAACDERRAFLTGFTGSAGTAVVTQTHACLWTDGRYHLQAASEMDHNWTLMKDGLPGTPSQGEWLSEVLPSAGGSVGVDPRLLSSRLWDTLSAELAAGGHRLRPVHTNLVDLVWTDRPARTANAVQPHPLRYTGMNVKSKLEEVRAHMKKKNCTLLVVAALDEIAYLLNLRGSDIVYNPVFFSYCVVLTDSVHLFVDPAQLSPAVTQHFADEGAPDLEIHGYGEVWSFLKDKAAALEGKAWLCPLSSHALSALFERGQREVDRTPPCTMKAVKNETEIQGMHSAHVRDAAALCTYLSWLEEQVAAGHSVTEVSGAAKLDALRAEQDLFVSLSFNTISSSGPNGAVIHYDPSEATDRPITKDELYLVDSGGQYRDGTTDVTRTVHFGQPTDHQKECFTRVLKGQIALATAVFPNKTRGTLLDPLARLALWQAGLDYPHGTGHGIGSFLNVHEGPQTIHSRPQPASEPGLEQGMFVSDEPGYYEDGQFGIRLENIIRVVPADTKHNFRGRGYLTFAHVTLVPVQTKMLVPGLLSKEEVSWLNDYHAEVRETVGPLLKEQGRAAAYAWLLRETEPLG
ncbi:Xaa-Pro aminopeptidase 1 [Amphibalanus amphitrite]|uniref:Xaa-Pro aminopeptidase 1 n=1 Tax=Amphibalanus amphitrite TaxID=1232801 RepID=A0A6A4WTX6_AMPAM|nr:xaa-Pro aminopeptidase 1-like isoform X1 [Amphibalanus amphitrite]XP_043198835.1 xaa-Pro aminopeptidase 1-like isoform X1 [Amphibalanus amphitrite]XP_043198836.1 xaa-Pro aminopeptidase 1-like isoform X2 [Amphibalanus amphitrite]KAF0307274.1 Xaa-Pro aminopeptidase 1 [Amphibalanus amphitrite]